MVGFYGFFVCFVFFLNSWRGPAHSGLNSCKLPPITLGRPPIDIPPGLAVDQGSNRKQMDVQVFPSREFLKILLIDIKSELREPGMESGASGVWEPWKPLSTLEAVGS